MKIKRASFPHKRLIKKKKHGFALIASLTLMMLLTLLAVGIMAMASSQSRIAMQTVLQAEARQQALIGLDDAIANLQIEMGPDRRVSASSGIISESEGSISQHILGVWDSWSGPIYGKPIEGKGSEIKSTYNQGRESMFRRWLISSRKPSELHNLQAVSDLGSRKPGQRICLVGEGTLGKRLTGRHYVYADLLNMPSTGKNKASFAWWVGGENQKSKISIEDREEATEPLDVLRRTWDTPGPMFVDSETMDFIPTKIEKPEKLLTLNSLPLVSSSSQSAGMPYFFDVTTSSYSLPINVRTGGLKEDLCLLLNKKDLKGTDFAVRSDQDCPLVEGKDVPVGTEKNMPIGSWQNLHAYYNCWPNGDANDSDNFTARLLGDVNGAYTRMSGSAYPQNSPKQLGNPDSVSAGSSASIYEGRAMLDQGSKYAGYARTPVMLAFMNTVGLVESPSKTSSGASVITNDERKEQMYDLGICYAPMFLWWNPYNVPMRIRGRQLWSHSLPYKVAGMQSKSFPQKRQVKSWDDLEWGDRGFKRTDNNIKEVMGQDFGEFFQASKGDETGDIVFNPGEILFFSPASGRVEKTQTSQDIGKNPWVPGYNPSSVAGNPINIYSHTSPGKVADYGNAAASNIDAGHFRLSLRLTGAAGSDGQYFAPKRPEAITIYNGFNGIDIGSTNGADGGDGKRAASPQYGLLGWYDPNDTGVNKIFCDPERNDAIWTIDGSQSDPNVPYFIAALGIVPKSANPNLDARMFEGKDYRTKMWQHSSPAFWGGMIISPDDQQRQYHPYQLAALDIGGGLGACPMDNIGRNGVLGITSDGEQVSFVSVLELPIHPPFSLAGFAGMRLQPGWYKSQETSGYAHLSAQRRMQYQSGVPGVGIGNSFADPCLPAGDVYAFHKNEITKDVGGNGQLFSDFFDHGLLINDALWDRWFCSSVSDMPGDGKKGRKAQEVMEDFLSGKEALPVSRYKKSAASYKDEEIIKRIMEKDGWKYIAQYLMIDGGFNVNSISEDAWASVLQGLAKRKLVTNVNGNKLSLVENNKSESQVLFSRFMVSTTDKSIDSLGGYSMMQGSTSLRQGGGAAAAWGEVRMLEPESIRELARQIVKQVRKRGPFLNMSDFINRRLDSAGSDTALKGALQAAIDATDINTLFNEVEAAKPGNGDLFAFPKAEEGSIYTAAPGYLIQSDVLASLGNILTVRDDTFTVRAYGCVRNARNAILAQAWCEAVVQRTMDYVDPTNAPSDREYEPDGSKGKGLSQANKIMGRKFRIVSFKWLDAWDI